MGGIVGKVTDAVGLTDNKGAKAAANAANKASDYAAAIAKESIAFQKEQYADWKDVYGELQDNLGNYYNSLTPERTIAMGLQNVQKEYQAAIKDINTTAAQRGIANSGLETGALTDARMDLAKTRAAVRTNAPTQVAQEKAGFLSIGLGQGTQMLQTIAGASNSAVNSSTQIAGNYLNRSTQLGMANMDAMGSIVGAGMGWASGGASKGYKV